MKDSTLAHPWVHPRSVTCYPCDPKSEVLKFWYALASPGGLAAARGWASSHVWLRRSGWASICMFNTFPGDAAAGLDRFENHALSESQVLAESFSSFVKLPFSPGCRDYQVRKNMGKPFVITQRE